MQNWPSSSRLRILEATPPENLPPRQDKNAIAALLQQHWGKILATVLFALLGWCANQIYTLDREVGELRVRLSDSVTHQSDKNSDVQRQIDRINDRWDRTHP